MRRLKCFFLSIIIMTVSLFAQLENLGNHFSESWVLDFKILNEKLYILNQHGVYLLNQNNEWEFCYKRENLAFNCRLYKFNNGLMLENPYGELLFSDPEVENWTSVRSGLSFRKKITSNGNIIGLRDSIYVSTDTAKTWESKASEIGNEIEISAIHKSENFIYVGAWGEIFVSENDGINWKNCNQSGLPDRSFIHSITSISDKTLFCSTDFGLYLSDDGGESWEQIKSEFSFQTGNVLTKLTAGKNNVYGLSGNYVYVFNTSGNGIPYHQLYVPSLLPAFSLIEYENDLYVGTSDGVYRFKGCDGEAEKFTSGLEMINVVTEFGNNDSCMLAVYYTLKNKNYKILLGSNDFGESWSTLNFTWDWRSKHYSNVVALGNEIYTTTSNNRLLHSSNFAKDWDTVLTPLPTIGGGTLLSTNGSLYYNSTNDDSIGGRYKLWVSHDKGVSWILTSFPFDGDRIVKTDSSTVIIDFLPRQATKVYISFDDLKTFSEAPFSLLEYMTGMGTNNPFNNSWIRGTNKQLYTRNSKNIYRSYDYGRTWEETLEDVDSVNMNGIIFQELFADSIMIGTKYVDNDDNKMMICYSFDLGKSWKVLKTPTADTMYLFDKVTTKGYSCPRFTSCDDYLFYFRNNVLNRIHVSYILQNDVPLVPNSSIKENMSLMVNTVSNKLKISCTIKNIALMTTEIFTAQGRKLYNHNQALKVGRNNFSLPSVNIASGCYLLKIQIGNTTHCQKVNFH